MLDRTVVCGCRPCASGAGELERTTRVASKKVIVVATGTAEQPRIEAAAFRIEGPDGKTQEHIFEIGTHEVGSGPCDLRLVDDNQVAPVHARIIVSPGGVTIIAHSNATPLFDGHGGLVPQVHRLQVDERIRIGAHALILRRPLPERSGSMPAPAASLPNLRRPTLNPTYVASPVVSNTATTSPEIPSARRAAQQAGATASDESEPGARDQEKNH